MLTLAYDLLERRAKLPAILAYRKPHIRKQGSTWTITYYGTNSLRLRLAIEFAKRMCRLGV